MNKSAVSDHLLLTFYSTATIFLQNSYRRGFLAADRTKLRQSTLEMMILKALTIEEMHSMGISHRIAEIAIC